jgi:hypothetical protein
MDRRKLLLTVALTRRTSAPATLDLTATTTGASQTVTLQRITPTGGTCTVSWGDGGADSIIANGNTGTTTHVYAAAGSYNITISDPARITYLDLRDSKLGCAAGEIGALTKLTYLHLYNVANVTVGAGEIGALTKLTYLYLYSVANVTVGAGEIGALTDLTYLSLDSVANVTVGTGEIGALTKLAYLYLYNVAGVTTQRADFATLLKLISLTYQNSLSGPQVDAILAGLYDGFPTRTGTNGTVSIATTNAAPSGTYQAASECPPTDGKEIAYELLNDTCDVSAKHWAVVTITA